MMYRIVGILVVVFLPFLGITQRCEGSLGDNLFTQGDFGTGEAFALTEDPEIAPGYTFVTDGPPSDGEYMITNSVADWSFVYDTWLVVEDNSMEPNGYMMVVNASFEPGLFYDETVEGLCDNTNFEFSADILNMIRTGVTDHSDPNVDFLIDDEVVLRTGNIPKNQTWNRYSFSFSTEPGQTSVRLSLRNNAPGGTGNDLALDNISFRACGPRGTVSSITQNSTCLEDLPVTLTGLLDGQEDPTQSYQWQTRQIDSEWISLGDSDSSRLTLTNVEPGDRWYRFASSASSESFGNEKCRFFSEPFLVSIPQREFEIFDTLCGGLDNPFLNGTPVAPGIFQQDLIASNGCDSIVIINLDTVRRETLEASILTNDPSCFGIADGTVEAINISGGYPPYSIDVNSSSYPTTIATDVSSGPALVIVKDRFDCFTARDVFLEEPAEFRIDIGPDLELILGDEVDIDVASSQPIGTIQWPESLTDFNGQSSFTFLPISSGAIIANATSEDGCSASDTIMLSIDTEVSIYVPNVFSPNGDNVNDRYFISPYGRSLATISTFSIYDRWGNEIWSATDVDANTGINFNNSWDGQKPNSGEVAPGVYTFAMKAILIDGQEIEESGTITVME